MQQVQAAFLKTSGADVNAPVQAPAPSRPQGRHRWPMTCTRAPLFGVNVQTPPGQGASRKPPQPCAAAGASAAVASSARRSESIWAGCSGASGRGSGDQAGARILHAPPAVQ